MSIVKRLRYDWLTHFRRALDAKNDAGAENIAVERASVEKTAAYTIERLVMALEPFARYANQHATADLSDEIGLAYVQTCGMAQLTMKDCRDARAALKAVEERRG